jgi:predicted nucleic-acid-binding protein
VLDARYERTAEQIATAVDMLLSHKDLTLQDADVMLCALKQFRKRPTVGFSHCLVLEIRRKAGHLPLGTFDRDLSRLDGAQRSNRTLRPASELRNSMEQERPRE